MELLCGQFTAVAQPASNQQLKDRVAAVRKPQRADLVDLARLHGKGKIVLQEKTSVVWMGSTAQFCSAAPIFVFYSITHRAGGGKEKD